MDGWDSFDLAGLEGERFHHIQRVGDSEPGLTSILRFCQRLSGLFEPPAAPVVESQPVTPDAEPGAAPDTAG